jgi:2,6-dihydroxypseudooxynicotine hydrolase
MRRLALSLVLGLTLFFLTGCLDMAGMSNVATTKMLGRVMLPRFIAHGANTVDVSMAQGKLEARPTDNWCAVWSDLAKDYEEKGQKNLEDNNLDDAKYQLLKAHVYYRIASYPFPLDEERKAAYDRAIELFKQYLKFLDNPPKVITLSHETKRMSGYLRLPRQDQKVPLVIVLPGLDWTKEECFWMEEHFLERGFATFSIDIPGTIGSEWALRADSDRMLQKVVEYFKKDSSIVAEKIFIVGFNFGGYWGLKIAAKDRDVRGVVAVDAPVHYAFESSYLNQMPRFMAEMFVKMTGARSYQEMYKLLGAMSLKAQDDLRSLKCPLLIIGAGREMFIPKEDLYIFADELRRPPALKIFPKQQYGIVDNYQSEVYPLIADWLEEQAR